MSPGTLAGEEGSRSARIVRAWSRLRRSPGAAARWFFQFARSARNHRTSRLPHGLIGMVGLVIAIECAVSQLGSVDTCRSQRPLSWRQSCDSVADSEAKADILCFGDSLVKLGVLPRVIEESLGLSAYNLAVLAGQPASSFFLFRQVLASGHRPRAVIVDFSAPLLTLPLRTNLEGWAELASCRDTIELALEAGDPALGIAIASRWLVPSRSRQAPYVPLSRSARSTISEAVRSRTAAFLNATGGRIGEPRRRLDILSRSKGRFRRPRRKAPTNGGPNRCMPPTWGDF